ncbi:MAG: TraR/DksA C4-type zinc finger protein [Synergistales bacterium]|nr:TraR/DksA C4-type zinc finger protein [Synergistales bacterium]
MDYEALKQRLQHAHAHNHGLLQQIEEQVAADDTGDPPFLDSEHLGEGASYLASRESDIGNVATLRHVLREIEHALHKIAHKPGEVGYCEICRKEISEERLRVKPWARYCSSCRSKREQRR